MLSLDKKAVFGLLIYQQMTGAMYPGILKQIAAHFFAAPILGN
jgi:hypothetical protein